MQKIVFLNGEFLPEDKAKVSIFDRGFLLADGVYEVVPVLAGKIIDVEPFLERFDRSLREISLEWPMPQNDYLAMLVEMVDRNDIQEGGVYTQVTRGVAARVFEFPKDLKPTCMAFGFHKDIIDSKEVKDGVKVVTVNDIRWKRRDIKSISLLGQCIAKNEAKEAGAYEGWMVEDGYVTEGTSSSAYIVKDGVVITRPLSNSILSGIRRKLILELAPKLGIRVEQRNFTIDEAYEADEAFLSSATTLIYSIIEIDGKQIGDGKVGGIAMKLRAIYLEEALKLVMP
ncbi:MAG: D-amino-acid transaminase [Sulfurovum sp.]|nr:D-amino-acid transaminase [Sulfurovum sp.]